MTIPLQPFRNFDGSVVYKRPGIGETPIPDATNEGVTVKLLDGSLVKVVNGVVTVTLADGQTVSTEKTSGLGDGKSTGNAMMAVGGAVAVFVPIGTIVGAIIAAAGALISAFSNGKAARKAEQEAQKFDASNVELQNQNAQLDAKISDLQNAIIKAKKDLGVKDSVSGLGWCMINCAKTQAKAHLKTAKELFTELTAAQNTRIETLQKLTAEAERLFLKKKTFNYAYIISGAILVSAGIYFVIKKSKS
jgi:gas vesicle protein